ncbi:MAG TPA: peptide chain release factor N(5)-glutamine methyltransferase [Clostridiales bacterium]|nr:peptide chain release factor N(5)-glutamine methyltransferase [Clostridiales bacterium]
MQKSLKDALTAGQQLLHRQGKESARLECEMLLSHILGWERHQLYLRGDELLSAGQLNAFESMLQRRLKGEPVQYILETKEFMGLSFKVDRRVLIPRWETELLVEYVLSAAEKREEPLSILDLGTGSGVLAVSLAVYLPKAELTAIDIREEALQVAAENAKNYNVSDRVAFLSGDLFTPLDGTGVHACFDIIVSNPPYIPTEEIQGLMPEVREYEPVSALDGGRDGLDFYRRIAQQAWKYLKEDGFIALEIGYNQGMSVQKLFLETEAYKRGEIHKDLAGRDRLAVFHKRQGVERCWKN